MDTTTYDLAIIGSGAAGFAAAIAARRRGLTVVMVERSTIGGTCVNTGCVPSKALLAAAQARHIAVEQRFPGVLTQAGATDTTALFGSKNDLVAAMRSDKYTDLAADYGWEIVPGTARFSGTADTPMLRIGDARCIEAAHFLVATGSMPWAPSIRGLAEAGYLTSTTAMALDRLPASMIVLGGNAVGLELAELFARLGVAVTIVEAADRLAPYEEPEISAAIETALVEEGIRVLTGATVTSVSPGYVVSGPGLCLCAEQLLVATGRRPVTAGLGLDEVGAQVGTVGEVVVNAQLRSTNPRIWAAGDVTGHPQFVYVAAAHGTLAVDNAFDHANRGMDYTHLPRVIFTSPAIAAVGLTEAELTARGIACDCRVLPLEYVPRAIVNRNTHGVIKLVAERNSGRIRGVHLVADGAGDVILAAVYAIRCGMTVTEMADTWAPYLTTGEALRLAAQTFTRDVTALSCCAS